MTSRTGLLMVMALLLGAAIATAHGPLPLGTANITLRYRMADGKERVLEDVRDFSGRDHEDATPLDGDHNINCFFAVNAFGIRPDVRGAIYEEESLIAHAFFKDHMDHSQNYFHDIASEDTIITVAITGIHFDEPVHVIRPTLLMHKFWDADQVDRLTEFYINLHNYGLSTDLWRDFDLFFPNVFTDFPTPNYAFGEMTSIGDVTVTGDGTDTISLTFAFPYSVFRHYEENGQDVPDDLPAPFGYLEPFHFHFEYIVAHEPPYDCGDIHRFRAACNGDRIKARIKARRLVGQMVTVESDGEWHVAVIGEDGRGKVLFQPRGPGEHTVRVEECPQHAQTVACGG